MTTVNIGSPLALLRSSRKPGLVLGGGAMRCAFQVGVIEALYELGIRPALCVGVSGGVWNAAAVAARQQHRLRYYWRAVARMPQVNLRNLFQEHSPFIWSEIHRRTFSTYVGRDRLMAADALPLLVGVTRLRDQSPVFFDARSVDDPLQLMLASNHVFPFFTHAPAIGAERYGDGGLTNNIPYEAALSSGCDAVVLVSVKGESEGGLFRNPRQVNFEIPEEDAGRVVVIRPRHRLPFRFVERRPEVLAGLFGIGYLRAREVLLGERYEETEVRARYAAPTLLLASLFRRAG